jgi:hypothetical protein
MKLFFDSAREAFGSLKQGQVDGMSVVLAATAHLALHHRAYILATAWHETAATMQPIYERGAKSYFNKYEPGSKIGKALGNTIEGDGYLFRGRGYVQLTGRANYRKAGSALGLDLLVYPEEALKPASASQILVRGMIEGWFTGVKLPNTIGFRDSRRVVNGLDRADLIAGYADKFEDALIAASPVTVQPEIAAPAPVDAHAPGPAPVGFWAWLASLFRSA